MRSLRLPLLVLTALVATLSAPSLSLAQMSRSDAIRDDRSFTFYDRGPYRSGIPRPEQLLGYDIGSMNTQFATQERVLLAIADAAKDRVHVEEIGSSYERRTMRLYIVSAPENIARLDEIRRDLDRLGDPRGASPGDLSVVAARTPAVVMINESVHGNEAPGFETAMQTLYQLAASDEPATINALKNVIVVLNPSTNPDGHERFSVWYNSIFVASPEPFSLEHNEPWSIQGRYNHYRFDMNRDVMTTTQREVQGLVRAMIRWHPMVAIDQHGQVSTYFFPPTAPQLNANMGKEFPKWMEIYGKANAEAFDKRGWMYYSRDIFDFFGPFYWDTWPSLAGAIGMTYETDGGGWKGVLWKRDDGTLLSFRDGIAKHYTTAMATIEATAAHKAERVRDYLGFRQAAIAEGRTGRMREVVLNPSTDPGRAAELVSTLLRSGIEVRRTTTPFSSARAHAYYDDAVGAQRFDAGVYVVDLAQPQGRLARAFLEPDASFDASFTQAQIERYKRNIRRAPGVNREGYEFYDVTAWSLPVTFGVDAYWTEDSPSLTGDLLSLPAEEPALPQAQTAPRRVGGELLAVTIPSGVTGSSRPRSAYIFSPERNGASRLAYHLLSEGYRVSSAMMPVEADGRSFPRGTYIVRVARNDSTLSARIDQLARESGVDVVGVNSAFTSAGGQFGIGSEEVADLKVPRVALVGEEGVSQTSYGAIWWGFERRYGIQFTPVSIRWLGFGDLAQFNVIIIPDASAGTLGRILGKDGADRIKAWVQHGGTLITMAGASEWAARENVALTSSRVVGPEGEKRDTTGIPSTVTIDTATATARKREKTSDRAPAMEDLLGTTSPAATNASPVELAGSHFDVVLDRTHWLTQGYERPRITVMLAGSAFFKLSKEGANVGVFPATGKLHRAGFAFPENTERLLRGTAFLIEEPLGDGHVILFANEPMFRGWWRALDRLVLNGVVLGPSL